MAQIQQFEASSSRYFSVARDSEESSSRISSQVSNRVLLLFRVNSGDTLSPSDRILLAANPGVITRYRSNSRMRGASAGLVRAS